METYVWTGWYRTRSGLLTFLVTAGLAAAVRLAGVAALLSRGRPGQR